MYSYNGIFLHKRTINYKLIVGVILVNLYVFISACWQGEEAQEQEELRQEGRCGWKA